MSQLLPVGQTNREPVYPSCNMSPHTLSSTRCHCGYAHKDHTQQALQNYKVDQRDWGEKYTTFLPTDAFGEMRFPSNSGHVSKVLEVSRSIFAFSEMCCHCCCVMPYRCFSILLLLPPPPPFLLPRLLSLQSQAIDKLMIYLSSMSAWTATTVWTQFLPC